MLLPLDLNRRCCTDIDLAEPSPELMLRLAFHLPLRQTEGLMASVFRADGPDGPVHLLIDYLSACDRGTERRRRTSPVEAGLGILEP